MSGDEINKQIAELAELGIEAGVRSWPKRLPRRFMVGDGVYREAYPAEWVGRDLWGAWIGEGSEWGYGLTPSDAWREATGYWDRFRFTLEQQRHLPRRMFK